METVTSRDGTAIAYWRSGAGPPLVLVHGSASDWRIWDPVRPGLEERFTVYAMNRRGREGSGVPAEYEIEREFEDVAAVANSVGRPVHLVGHSAGAICALGAALLTDCVRSLILYEPPPLDPRQSEGAQVLRGMIEDGRAEDATAAFLQVGPERSAKNVELLKHSPVWRGMVEVAATLPGELDMLSRFQFEVFAFRTIDVPVLLLVGAESTPPLRERSKELADVIPNAMLRELPGQRHFGNVLAPDLFLSGVLSFLERVEE